MLSAEHPKKLFLLDAYALIYRAYFAFSKIRGSAQLDKTHPLHLALQMS